MKTFGNFSSNHNTAIQENSTQNTLKNSLEKTISERGFYLYEWISPEEFKTSIRANYMEDMYIFSQYLFWISGMAGVIFMVITENFLYTIVGIIGIMILFHIGLGLKLIFGIFQKGKIFTKFGNIAITDNHIISGENILEHNQIKERKQLFLQAEEYFHESFLGDSLLPTIYKNGQDKFTNSITNIWQIVNKFSNKNSYGNRNNGMNTIWVIFFATAAVFTILLGISYFIALPFIVILSTFFTKIFHKILLLKNATEYKIHYGFQKIDENSKKLTQEKTDLIRFLQDAQHNNWLNNLGGNIETSFKNINTLADSATNESLKLKNLLNNSRYKEIFNFDKLNSWLKKEILEPINEIIILLEKNQKILENTNSALLTQIQETQEISHKQPLELQQKRIEIKIAEIGNMKNLLTSYQEKLQ